MTKEEKEELFNICRLGVGPLWDFDERNHKGIEIVSYILNNNKRDNLSFDFDDFNILLNWLNKKHFDYKGLIEKGLALEAPEDMYN